MSQYAGRRVLVTGASGFIGAALCRRLINDDAKVYAVSRRVSGGNQEGICWWQGDLSQIDVVQSLVATIEPQIVFHLASHVAGSRDLALVLPTFGSNLVSTINLMSVLADQGCESLVLAGSMEEPLDADDTPGSPYAATKWASSGYARMFHALYGLPVVIARIFMTYGPAQPDRTKLIPYVIDTLLQGHSPRLTSGERMVDWVYVEDVVDGLLALAIAPGVAGSTLDLGAGELVPIRRVVEHLVALTQPTIIPQFGAVPARPMEHSRRADITATYTQIGWQPRTTLDQGLAQTVAWYRNHQASSGEQRQ